MAAGSEWPLDLDASTPLRSGSERTSPAGNRESGIQMKNVRVLGIAIYAAATLSAQSFVGCAPVEGESPPSLAGRAIMNTAAPDDGDVNPQRNPELWTRPRTVFAAGVTPNGNVPSLAPTYPGGVMPFRGINLAGGEFGNVLPGVHGKDYTFPTFDEIDYYVGKRMNTFRIGFKWERLQPETFGDFDQVYFDRLDAVVNYATSKGAHVILNPHNFARYYGKVVGSSEVPSAAFADFWGELAAQYRDNPLVVFNLVNEPHDLPTEQWVDAANAAIAAIRSAAAPNPIIVPGNSWTGAHSWNSSSYGTPNSVAMLDIADPLNNVIFEVHQYMDSDSSGGSGECVNTTIGRQRMQDFVEWLRMNNRKGFLGEFAGGNNPTCNAAVKDMVDYVYESSDVLVGWLWWAGGPWWGDYKFTLNPKNGQDRPQMSLLAPYLD
jgi:endoglucanase